MPAGLTLFPLKLFFKNLPFKSTLLMYFKISKTVELENTSIRAI